MVSRMTVGILRLLKREPQPRTRRARPGAVSKEQIMLMMGLSAVKEGTIVPTAATALKTEQSIVACRLMSRDRPTKAAMNSSAVKATKVRKSALFAVAEETKKPLALNHAKRSANPTIRAPSIAMGPFFRVVLSAVMLILPLYLSCFLPTPIRFSRGRFGINREFDMITAHGSLRIILPASA